MLSSVLCVLWKDFLLDCIEMEMLSGLGDAQWTWSWLIWTSCQLAQRNLDQLHSSQVHGKKKSLFDFVSASPPPSCLEQKSYYIMENVLIHFQFSVYFSKILASKEKFQPIKKGKFSINIAQIRKEILQFIPSPSFVNCCLLTLSVLPS